VKRAGSSRCGRWTEDCCGSSRGLSGPKGEKDPPDTAADNLTVGSLCRPLTFRVKTAVYSRHEGRPAGGGSKAELELIEALWDTLAEQDLPVTPEEQALLDARLADLDANPNDQSPWEDVKARLKQRRR